MALLEVTQLSISFLQYTKGSRQQTVTVMENLDLAVNEGEIVAVVGASGSGKSLLAHAIMGILPANAVYSGSIRYGGELLDEHLLRQYRGNEIALVPQSVTYLNPLMRVGSQLQTKLDGKAQASERKGLFKRLGLGEHVNRLFPFQLSGGMARKVLVSTAAHSRSRLIIADEPTPGMHPADVAEALSHFKQLAEEGCAVLFITHDIEAAIQIANRVAVIYAGAVVEVAPASDFQGEGEQLRHPYSKALWQALPGNGFIPIAGSQPSKSMDLQGCLFADRCMSAVDSCMSKQPEPRQLRGGTVRCLHAT
ncbi:peptide/nickel transport system ATP-binding protein [Paenibacillus endophyticus]|uniref:Nickel import system ATP-binding protein NikD n=1 Tax=Paenibacillus endophyticus TaxID=1294268 RepID=A0A7W5C9H3_9BACL|nr:ABC transporter ATP-binding protein [Paenibacillus endophyticus]MBB3153119.1 peptide/nickel transport system ATP-binding protein [Paenibacillus endophyticus]